MAEQMTPAKLAPQRSALTGVALVDVRDVAQVEEAQLAARLVLRTTPQQIERLLQWSGLAAPSRINSAVITGGRAVMQLGPDEWWILADTEQPAAIAAAIAQSAGGIAHALVDITDRNAGLAISGPAVEACLATGCPLPLSLPAFPVGRATRTLFGRAEIVLWRVGPERFHVETGRSFAPYLAGLIGAAIRDEAAIRRQAGGQS